MKLGVMMGMSGIVSLEFWGSYIPWVSFEIRSFFSQRLYSRDQTNPFIYIFHAIDHTFTSVSILRN